jgi:hypothetical protein
MGGCKAMMSLFKESWLKAHSLYRIHILRAASGKRLELDVHWLELKFE